MRTADLPDGKTRTMKLAKRNGRVSRQRWLRLALLLPALLWIIVVALLEASTARFVHGRPEDVPAEPVAIVFGAGLLPGGKPSLILRGRLDGGIELYRRGKVQKLLMSGDNRFVDYNEPEAMRKYAVAHRVKDQDIVLDFAGRDTYDTCYRAKHLFGIDKAILVTQHYHASRAVFTARALGIDAKAYSLPDLKRYPGLQFSYSVREYLADLKALWDVGVTHRRPYIDAGRG